MEKKKTNSLQRVLTTPFSLDKNKIKTFMKENLDLYAKLPTVIEENQTNKHIVENTVRLLSLIAVNAKMLPILKKLISIKTNKSSTIKLLKLMDTVLSSVTQVEMKAIKFEPIIFYDYLFSYAKSDDVILQVYGLMGLYNLIQNHELTVPNYLQLLYSTLTKRLLYSPLLGSYYDRVYKYLVGRNNPLYISACFVKKSLRLTLEEPTGAVIILLHFVMKMLFSLPQIRYLLKIPSVPVYKYPEFDPFEVEEDSEEEEDDDDENDEENENKSNEEESNDSDENENEEEEINSEEEKKERLIYKMTRDLRDTNVEKTFLWEHLLLQNHPHPKVSLLAQSFPKSPDDKVEMPPEINVKNVNDPKISPMTTTISLNINPFLIQSNTQTVNIPSEKDCLEMGITSSHSLFDDYFD